MHPNNSPFPFQWWAIGLEAAGLGDERPDVGTYGRYDFSQLPQLPFELDGSFAWLTGFREYEHNIAKERAKQNRAAIESLIASAHAKQLKLPEAFVLLARSMDLQRRIRSCTDCFFDLCPDLIRSPIGDGYLVRFLADSQGCVFWYLYLTPDGNDHAVVSSINFYGIEEEDWGSEEIDHREIGLSEESFEKFICRFWIENEIWFSAYEKMPIPEFGLRYIEDYRRRARGPA